MGEIYYLPDGRSVAMIPEGNQIIYYLLQSKSSTMPVILKRDYLKSLSAVLHMGVLYYCYYNLEHQIVLDGIGNFYSKVILTEGGTTKALGMCKLTVFSGVLCLLYTEDVGGCWQLKLKELEGYERTRVLCERKEEIVFSVQAPEANRLFDEIYDLRERLIVIKKQYDEVSKVARKLQEAARKWNKMQVDKTNALL